MTFLNRKEEVIDIELTQHGKHLLSNGKFKPAYYQFFDDDIIYDIQYAGCEDELQRDIQTRIKETPRTHVQYTFVSSEEEVKKTLNQVRNENIKKGSFTDVYVPYNLKHRVMASPLYNSELGKQNKPAWNIRTINGEFSNTITYVTGTFANFKVPRLTHKDIDFKIATAMDIDGKIYAPGDVGNTVSDVGFTPTSDLNNLTSRFKDGSYIQIQENYILLDLQELNSRFEQENFDIELYEITKNENDEEILTQLFFSKKTENVINNILLDTEEQLTEYKPNRSEMVETYFIIQADREISSQILCKDLTQEEKLTLVATNQLDLDCEELYGNLTDPRITSDVKPEDLVEKC